VSFGQILENGRIRLLFDARVVVLLAAGVRDVISRAEAAERFDAALLAERMENLYLQPYALCRSTV
jgi:hypothetical protein